MIRPLSCPECGEECSVLDLSCPVCGEVLLLPMGTIVEELVPTT